jgi:delta 1-pyrroline-5-carboxylate dehydrogenase
MELHKSSRIVTTPQEMEQLEREIRMLTDRLAAAMLGQKVQASLDADEMTEAEAKLIQDHPQRMKSEGKKRSHSSHVLRQ